MAKGIKDGLMIPLSISEITISERGRVMGYSSIQMGIAMKANGLTTNQMALECTYGQNQKRQQKGCGNRG